MVNKILLLLLFFLTKTYFIALADNKPNTITASKIDTSQVKMAMSKIANKIVESTNYYFVDKNTNQLFTKLQDIPKNTEVKLNSDFNEWEYQNSLVCFGLERLHTVTQNDETRTYTNKKINFFADNYPFFDDQRKQGIKTPYHLYFGMYDLWFCGLAANAVDVYAQSKDERLKVFINKFENHIFNKQTRWTDQTWIRVNKGKKVVQSDDTYMAFIFLVRMYKLTGDQKYLDEAVKQAILYQKYLFDPKDKLYHHVWYCDQNRYGGQYWGRGNGWMILSLVELLDYMPKSHPDQKIILSFYTDFIHKISKLQKIDGLWPQVLNVDSSFSETSCSAMFVYSMARGINKGWISKKFSNVTYKGWNGLVKKITQNNEIESVCVATHYSDDLAFYLNRKTINNDRHVLGSFLMAGVEIIKMNR